MHLACIDPANCLNKTFKLIIIFSIDKFLSLIYTMFLSSPMHTFHHGGGLRIWDNCEFHKSSGSAALWQEVEMEDLQRVAGRWGEFCKIPKCYIDK